ncbi:MAG: DUF1353 domain-containing protein [Lentisphaeria bacterium]|nr:DUF1353 domain-containing protein [Lentisphaeria bacterium]
MVKVAIHHADENGNIITLLDDITVVWCGQEYTVPAGFSCDGCSVPAFLWDSVSPQLDPRTLRGAIVHDYIYRGNVPEINRKEADMLLRELIKEDGFPAFKAGVVYWGVRLAGGGNYHGEAA